MCIRDSISGVNQGPNLSIDIMHSGTVSAARESALYGMPSIAISLATYEHSDFTDSVKGAIKVIDSCLDFLPINPPDLLRPNGSKSLPEISSCAESIREHFSHGNIFLNLNAPLKWNQEFNTVSLGARWYRNAIKTHQIDGGGMAFEVGAAMITEEDIPMTDCSSVNAGEYAISPLSSWPVNHPLGIPKSILLTASESDDLGLPFWFNL